ncbi:hypothetical protein JG688_00002176 [Phytophthora aleatoria]|uniref:Uncharacterized protein n=1 Tax=Phytophthora aleatoria TaxID=2496075 RepID=A0A8J5MAY5_9STRA|nr:hypothetical protein JG688_00002176 [Phytophthora aleatoria]
MEQDTEQRRTRKSWRELWITGDDGSYEDFIELLPAFVRVKNNLLRCTMNHVDRDEDCLAANFHEMRCIVTKCASQRCAAFGNTCGCHYKILACEEVDFKSVFVQETHAMTDGAPDSPINPKLTDEMKTYILAKLDDSPSMVPQLLFAFLCREVQQNRMHGPRAKLRRAISPEGHYTKKFRFLRMSDFK